MSWIADFHFLRPQWLLLLAPVMVMLWYLYRSGSIRSGWQSVVDQALLPYLVEGGQKRRLPLWLLPVTLAWVAAILALSGPSWQRIPQPIEKKSDALVIVVDMSLSMHAADPPPSRLEHLRYKVTDILRARTEGLTALIAYAGDEHLVAPLTDDVETLINLLPALRPENMPLYGSRPAPAMRLATRLMEEQETRNGRILLITDGIDQPSEFLSATPSQYQLSVLGIGTTRGAPIPLRFNANTEFVRDASGALVIARADHDGMRELTARAGGLYSPVTATNADIELLLAQSWLVAGEDLERIEREIDVWLDQGYWLILLCLPALLLLFRRGGLALLTCCLLSQGLWPQPARADLWQREDQQAHALFLQDQHAEAALKFKDPSWRASANYRAQDFAAAAELWARSDSANGHYNRGNALAYLGDVVGAINAYEQALTLDPEHADAAFNRDLLQELLNSGAAPGGDRGRSAGEDQENPSSRSGQQGNQESEQDAQSSQQEQAWEAGNTASVDQETEQEEEQFARQNQDAEGEQKEDADHADSSTDEAGNENSTSSKDSPQDELTRQSIQELEQWLRRIPDEPGGLLARKFRHETDQRLRNGDKQAPQGQKIW